MQFPKSLDGHGHVRYISTPQPIITPSDYGTIRKLSDEVLLNIFRHYLDASPQFWPQLIHICRKWRHIVLASKRVLHLRLFCTHGTSILKALDYWPTIPIVVQYGGPSMPYPPAPEDEDNIMTALKQSDRVSSICLTVTSSLLKKLSTIEGPFSELEDLVLLSRDNEQLTLPSAFRWGPRLRTLHMTRDIIPALPRLLSHSTSLVDLQLHEIPNVRYCPPEAFASALSGMTRLRSLSLHFLSFRPGRNHLGLPPRSRERVSLPALTCLKYRGTSKYLDNLLARIDAPSLGDIGVAFVSQPTIASQLDRFISRIEMHKSHRRADILISERTTSISFTQPEAPTRLELQVFCKQFARRLSYMAWICNGLSALLPGVEHLHVCTTTQLTIGQDDSERAGWLDLIGSFTGVKWFHLTGDHSTNIMLALKHHGPALPSLHKVCIRQPEPHHRPSQEAVESFMHSRLLSGHFIGVELINECRGTEPFFQRDTDVLLNIFHHFLHAYPQIWHTLAHVCQKWRQIVLSSPLGLRLRLYCTYGTPVLKVLQCWPPFPLVLSYGGSPELDPPAPEDEESIITALEQSDRVHSISLTLTNSLLENLPKISEPLSELKELVLLSRDCVELTLPSAFCSGPHLRTLHLIRVAIPALPQLLSPSTGLVDLQLHEIPKVGYFSPDAFANALSEMTQLETLSLHFLSFPPRQNYVSLPPPPGERIALLALTHLKYRGTSKYFDSFVAKIDTPRLGDIDITFFNQPSMDASQLGRFIGRSEMQASLNRAVVQISAQAISITFPSASTSPLLHLQISCEQLDWQLSSMAQICNHFFPFLFHVKDLQIASTQSPNGEDLMADEQWLELIRAFGHAEDFIITSVHAMAILRALRPAEEGDRPDSNVLPFLRNLHLQAPRSEDGPLRDAAESFINSRRLSGLPVGLHWRLQPKLEDRQLNMTDALDYLDAVKIQFNDRPDVYNAFLDIMKDFKSQVIDTPGVIQRVAALLHGHPFLIQGLSTFLPVGYRIEVGSDSQSSKVITITTPSGTMLRSIDTSNPASPPPSSALPPQELGPLPPSDQPAVSAPLPSTSALGLSNTPKLSGSSVDLPATDDHERQVLGPAMEYVRRIKTRFSNDPDTYKQFLEILSNYKFSANNAEIISQVEELFEDAPDLSSTFVDFLLADPNGFSVLRGLGTWAGMPTSRRTRAQKRKLLGGSGALAQSVPAKRRRKAADGEKEKNQDTGRAEPL